MEFEKQHIRAEVEQKENGKLEFAVFSDNTTDRVGEIIDPQGWDLKNFQRNPVLLWAHDTGLDASIPAIGTVENLQVNGNKLVGTPVFDLDDPFAKLVHDKFKKGILRAFSVGFMPKNKSGNVFTESELLEISAVNVPANANALTQIRSMEGLSEEKQIERDAIVELMEAYLNTKDYRANEEIEEVEEVEEEVEKQAEEQNPVTEALVDVVDQMKTAVQKLEGVIGRFEKQIDDNQQLLKDTRNQARMEKYLQDMVDAVKLADKASQIVLKKHKENKHYNDSNQE